MGTYGTKKKINIIKLFLRSYVYSDKQLRFVATPAMPWHLPHQICRALSALHAVDQGQSAAFKANAAVHAMHSTVAALWAVNAQCGSISYSSWDCMCVAVYCISCSSQASHDLGLQAMSGFMQGAAACHNCIMLTTISTTAACIVA